MHSLSPSAECLCPAPRCDWPLYLTGSDDWWSLAMGSGRLRARTELGCGAGRPTCSLAGGGGGCQLGGGTLRADSARILFGPRLPWRPVAVVIASGPAGSPSPPVTALSLRLLDWPCATQYSESTARANTSRYERRVRPACDCWIMLLIIQRRSGLGTGDHVSHGKYHCCDNNHRRLQITRR